jgi:hypothetical protein
VAWLCPCAAAGIYGALYCLADVHTEFSEVAKQLKEVAELLGQGLNRQLGGQLLHEYLVRSFCIENLGQPVMITSLSASFTASAVSYQRAGQASRQGMWLGERPADD